MKCVPHWVQALMVIGVGMRSWSVAHADTAQEAANKQLVRGMAMVRAISASSGVRQPPNNNQQSAA